MSEFSADPATTVRTEASAEPEAPATSAPPLAPPVHEAYAFACLNCGYGWEQAYDIEHRTDTKGHPVTYYRANGVPVPSPLMKPSCPGCGGEHVRIMRAGRVAEAASYWRAPQHPVLEEDTRSPAERREAYLHAVERLESERREAEQREAQRRETQRRETQRREPQRREAQRSEEEPRQAERAEAEAEAGQPAGRPVRPEPRPRRRLHLPFHFRLRRYHHNPPSG